MRRVSGWAADGLQPDHLHQPPVAAQRDDPVAGGGDRFGAAGRSGSGAAGGLAELKPGIVDAGALQHDELADARAADPGTDLQEIGRDAVAKPQFACPGPSVMPSAAIPPATCLDHGGQDVRRQRRRCQVDRLLEKRTRGIALVADRQNHAPGGDGEGLGDVFPARRTYSLDDHRAPAGGLRPGDGGGGIAVKASSVSALNRPHPRHRVGEAGRVVRADHALAGIAAGRLHHHREGEARRQRRRIVEGPDARGAAHSTRRRRIESASSPCPGPPARRPGRGRAGPGAAPPGRSTAPPLPGWSRCLPAPGSGAAASSRASASSGAPNTSSSRVAPAAGRWVGAVSPRCVDQNQVVPGRAADSNRNGTLLFALADQGEPMAHGVLPSFARGGTAVQREPGPAGRSTAAPAGGTAAVRGGRVAWLKDQGRRRPRRRPWQPVRRAPRRRGSRRPIRSAGSRRATGCRSNWRRARRPTRSPRGTSGTPAPRARRPAAAASAPSPDRSPAPPAPGRRARAGTSGRPRR